jgi:hypothetical protein
VILVVLTMRHVTGRPSADSQVDGARMLALLPRQWDKDFRQAGGFIAIRINTDETVSPAHIRAQVVAILANPEVSRWRLVSCETLTPRTGESKGGLQAITVPHILQNAEWN